MIREDLAELKPLTFIVFGKEMAQDNHLPPSVLATLKKHPECSLSQTESSSFSHFSGSSAGHQTTEHRYYLQCPFKPPQLIHSESSKRSIPSSEYVFSAREGVFPGPILGGSFDQHVSDFSMMEGLLRDMLSSRSLFTSKRQTSDPSPSYPPSAHPPRSPSPGSCTSIAV